MTPTIAVTGLNAGENPQPGSGVIRSLRRCFPDICVVGLAYGPHESGIYVDGTVDIVYQIPCLSAGIDAFMDRIDYIRARHPIDMLIPTLDAEIITLIQVEDRLKERGIKTVLPSLQSFLARSKEYLDELVPGTGTVVPKSVSVSSVDALAAAAEGMRFPVMVKGASYDALKATSSLQLSRAFEKIMAEWGGPVIVQEFISGEEFDIAAVGDGSGRLTAACSIRKSVRSEKGKGYGGIVVDDPELAGISRRIIEKLKWNGPCELEFVQDAAEGRYFLIEMNPRFPAWIDFPSSFGYNLPKLVIDRMTGAESDPLPSRCPTGYFFLRHAIDIPGRIEDLGQLTARGELPGHKNAEADASKPLGAIL